MDDFNSKTSQNMNNLNGGGDNTGLVGDVRVEDQTEGLHETAKRCKLDEPKQITEQQTTEANLGAGGVEQSRPKTPPLLTQPPAAPPQTASNSKPTPKPVSKKNKKRKRPSGDPNFSTGAIQPTTSNQFQECAWVNPADEDRSTFPSFRFMSVKIKMGLCAADHPRVYLTNFQLDTLAQLILNIILGPEGERVKPRFYGMKMVNGHLTLICGDYTTAAWVKELPNKLLLGDIRLKAVECPADNKSFVVVGHFRKSQHESVERILRFLEVQNQGLNCSRWRVMDRNLEKSAVRITFAVDWESAQLLKAKGPLLNFKFSKARFMLKTKRGVKFKEEEGEDDDEDDLEFVQSFPAMDDFNPFAQSNPFTQTFGYGFPHGMPFGSPMQPYPGMDFGGDYSARVASAVRKASTTLCEGLTSRERFLQKKKRRKKKKGKPGPG